MTAGNVSNGICHSQNRESKGKRYAEKSYAYIWKCGRNNSTSASSKTNHAVPINSAVSLFVKAIPLNIALDTKASGVKAGMNYLAPR